MIDAEGPPPDSSETQADIAGPAADFRAFYERHAGWVYSLSLRMTADPVAAREAVQDVFVRAWRKAELYREGRAAGWLKKLTLRVLLNRARSDHRWTRRLDDHADLATLPAQAGEGIEDRLALEAAIRALPKGARTVVVLHDVEGYSMSEVATHMGTAVGTVKSQLHRGRRLLREALED
ncbi:MAG: RNA polymerase sigma factor [Gemmatimonadota bacterium]